MKLFLQASRKMHGRKPFYKPFYSVVFVMNDELWNLMPMYYDTYDKLYVTGGANETVHSDLF